MGIRYRLQNRVLNPYQQSRDYGHGQINLGQAIDWTAICILSVPYSSPAPRTSRAVLLKKGKEAADIMR